MKNTILAIAVALVVVWLAVAYSGKAGGNLVDGSNVYLENGKQIVEITAKGGYSPVVSTASSSMPTILRVKTDSTFDCSSFLVIPSMNVSRTLPQTGNTDIDLGMPTAGTLSGTCSMGMYSFAINFD
jgi:plastocyanin domain-containing protein